jgi:hypothetical protein
MSTYNMSPNKVKKLTLQYSYLILEKDEVEDACLTANKEMHSYIKEHYADKYEEFCNPPKKNQTQNPDLEKKVEEEDDKGSEDEDKQEEDSSLQSSGKNKEIKKLYRKIAEKTHPDKIGTDENSEMFSQASQAYANQDIATLLNIAGNVGVTVDSLSEESLLILEENIKTISFEIYNMKKTAGWSWSRSKSDDQRRSLIIELFKFKGVNHE